MVVSTSSFPVPQSIPGQLVTNYEDLTNLRSHLSNLCGLSNLRFPGAQPVSFKKSSLDLLTSEDFWVCEKSDGVRVLVFAVGSAEAGPEIYLVDRKERFYLNTGFVFPKHTNPAFVHDDTVLDAELVIDVDPDTQQQHLRLLTFDCLVLDGENLMHKSLTSRYGRLLMFVIEPYQRMLREFPDLRHSIPFEVVPKKMEKAYGIEAVFRDHMPNLQHGNDGLIFTSAVGRYVCGTDQKILKWKPPSENSIDFRLDLRFPALDSDPAQLDLHAKPMFILMMNCGQEGEEVFDFLDISDDEWEEIKASGEQMDNRVVEVVWDAPTRTCRMLRFREDKREGNFRSVVYGIVESIIDGVEASQLVEAAPRIKGGWREREANMREQAKLQAQAEAAARQAAKEQASVPIRRPALKL